MAAVDNPIGLMSEKNHAFAEGVAGYVTMIINGVRQRQTFSSGHVHEMEGVGAGSACLWKGKKLILTAEHVLDGAEPSDLRFFIRRGGKIDWGTRPSRPEPALGVSLSIDRIVRCESEDIACIVLSNTENRFEFVRLPKAFAKVPPAGGCTLLYGCPSDTNVPVAAARTESALHVAFAAQPRGCWAVVRGDVPPRFPSSFDPSKHFLLNYDPAEEGAMPHGFSGAGVWYRRAARDTIWCADPVLAGVQKSWHKPSNTMIVIRSSVVRHFLKTEFP